MINDEAKIIPGHGPIATKRDLKNYYKMVSESIAFVANQGMQRKSMKEIMKIGFPEQFSHITGYIPASSWIETVYADISQ